ncbi:hypothetical protein MKW98_024266 [Papaver atlanticum]|uniref:Uncharacterized protein n=1 Tax=Papaver atlanticum TaxID=357466 RepID=A0AAD4T1P3_9MAGN|nr:hypothetical protein MKW98_024266 [Papaver atlanticum]
MEEQKNSSSAEALLGFSSLGLREPPFGYQGNSTPHNHRDFTIMSKEEMEIRMELEREIENDLQQEIENGMHNLALRLHQLYKHRRERNVTSFEGSKIKIAMFSNSGMSLRINLEEEPPNNVKEMENRNLDKVPRAKNYCKDEKSKHFHNRNMKNFDSVNTLRSSPSKARNDFVASPSTVKNVRKERKKMSARSTMVGK